MHHAFPLSESFYLSNLLTHQSNSHSFHSTSSSPLLLPYFKKNLIAFVPFLISLELFA